MKKLIAWIIISLVFAFFIGLAGYYLYFEARYKIIKIGQFHLKYDKWTDSAIPLGQEKMIKEQRIKNKLIKEQRRFNQERERLKEEIRKQKKEYKILWEKWGKLEREKEEHNWIEKESKR